MITCEKPTIEGARYIVQHLREKDRSELAATAFDKSLSSMADVAMRSPGVKFVFCKDGEPVFIAGLIPSGDKCVQAWGFGTNKTKLVMRSVTKKTKKVISALVKSGEINRVQALCMAAVAPLRWLDVIGLNRSADLGPMGSDQTEFVMKYGVFGER